MRRRGALTLASSRYNLHAQLLRVSVRSGCAVHPREQDSDGDAYAYFAELHGSAQLLSGEDDDIRDRAEAAILLQWGYRFSGRSPGLRRCVPGPRASLVAVASAFRKALNRL